MPPKRKNETAIKVEDGEKIFFIAIMLKNCFYLLFTIIFQL